MNRNHLKIIACVSMLIDHIGFVLFPGETALRLIGRIAMPIFAFFIGEGCLYTRDRKKYFLRVFILGLICQAVYIAESFISNSGNGTYFNILLTFSLSIVLCSAFLRMKESLKVDNSTEKHKYIFIFLLAVCGILALTAFCNSSYELTGTRFYFDYGIYGIFLPLFAAVTKEKTGKLLSFFLALTVCVFGLYDSVSYRICALIPIILLALYNGKSGKRKLKYFFYAFYPCHLAAIYLINLIL